MTSEPSTFGAMQLSSLPPPLPRTSSGPRKTATASRALETRSTRPREQPKPTVSKDKSATVNLDTAPPKPSSAVNATKSTSPVGLRRQPSGPRATRVADRVLGSKKDNLAPPKGQPTLAFPPARRLLTPSVQVVLEEQAHGVVTSIPSGGEDDPPASDQTESTLNPNPRSADPQGLESPYVKHRCWIKG